MSTLRRIDYLLIVLGVLVVYGLGLFLPILNSDPAFNATVALRMYQTGDYASLINQFDPYLDKPHLSFWLAAASFEVFGVSAWAYRLPSLLVSLLGVYATFRLGKEAYTRDTGIMAAIILTTFQAQILANHDVRMDALLTGFVAMGAWQLYRYIKLGYTGSLIWAAIMAGLAFNTKGMVGVGVLGIAFLVEIVYRRAWSRLFNWVMPEAFIAFGLTILPVLWAYFVQFDQHPELVVQGRTGVSGLRFILWDQNFERMSGGRFGQDGANDPFFFFHTLLWAALPWSVLIYAAWVTRFFKLRKATEWFTGGGALACMIVFSFSSFKLPHYLNILFPLMAVWAASWFIQSGQLRSKARWYFNSWVQSVVPFLMIVVALVLAFWVFERGTGMLEVALIVGFGVALGAYLITIKNALRRAFVFSALGALYVNAILNGIIYPELTTYQAGSRLAEVIRREKVPVEKVYFAAGTSLFYDLELGIEHIIPSITPAQLRQKLRTESTVWLVVEPKQAAAYLGPGLKLVNQRCYADFHVTRLTGTFLNPDTRSGTLGKYCLVEVSMSE